jgi:hypothetical protein
MIGGFFGKAVKKPFGCRLVTYTFIPTTKALRGFYDEHTPTILCGVIDYADRGKQ